MENNKVAKITNRYTKQNNNKTVSILKVCNKNSSTENYKIYTKEIIGKYKNSFKTILKSTNNKTKTKFIMYDEIWKWYNNEDCINLSMEKIYIKTKLGSYTSGGCGIGASLFAGLTASGIFSYMDSYIKRLGPLFLTIYVVLVLCFGFRILSNEDNKVEMYNMFLEVLNNLENDKNDK